MSKSCAHFDEAVEEWDYIVANKCLVVEPDKTFLSRARTKIYVT